eukprot:m.96984 g.96984  ORF g.96984 m.96984 type:complete len:371 (+) comp8649_c0_seq3:90-1202(+)
MSGATERGRLSDEEENRLEQEHFAAVMASFRYYRQHAYARLDRSLTSYHRLPPRHQALVPGFLAHTASLRAAVDSNAELAARFADCSPFGEPQDGDNVPHAARPEAERPREMDMDKVYTTLKQLVRDWAAEGRAERDQCYGPVLAELARLFPSGTERAAVRVCVPGAGLARLVFEVARLGFEAQGNEWSVHMLLASHVVLNSQPGTLHTPVYPWAHIFTNNYAAADQLQRCLIPDTDPYDLPETAKFSMAAGDFLEIYSGPEWDCVATCFFIDTARIVIDYIEKIYEILRPGGYWINFGPLLYHFDDNMEAPSIELPFDQVREIITAAGFEMLAEDYPRPCGYISNPRSMYQMSYNCVFFTARKPLDAAA